MIGILNKLPRHVCSRRCNRPVFIAWTTLALLSALGLACTGVSWIRAFWHVDRIEYSWQHRDSAYVFGMYNELHYLSLYANWDWRSTRSTLWVREGSGWSHSVASDSGGGGPVNETVFRLRCETTSGG